ncbi:hypothetical protein Vafri_12932 [Volvox africanus]|nr:hypothetical protein Vafri_12932 [Volvox africanus]
MQSNSGRQSGGIYFIGHPDSRTVSTGCTLTLRRVVVQDCWGYQSGAILASCVVKGSMCSLNLQDTLMRKNNADMSGIIMAREYGMSVAAVNLTMADNYGGAFGSVQVAATFKESRFINNTGLTFAAMDVWGGLFTAQNTEFLYNMPLTIDWFKSAAFRMSNSYGGRILNCTFEGNTVHALFVYSAAAEVFNCTFRKNRAVAGSTFPYGAAMMLYGSTYHTIINHTVFEDNVALAGGAVMLSSTQDVTFLNCLFQRNRAVSGGALEVDIPVVTVSVYNTQFINNTAVGLSETLFGEGGVVRYDAQNGSLEGDSSLTAGDYDYDYDRGVSDTDGKSELRVPVESCGTGGGGAACVRGATGSEVSFTDVVFRGNKAYMGGGIYVATGSRCQQLVQCYSLKLGPNVTFTDNYADLAGGAVYWLYEKIIRTECARTDPSLVPPAWPGLLGELQSHRFTTISQATIVASANITSAVAAIPEATSQSPPQSHLAPPPAPEAAVDGGGGAAHATHRYMKHVMPCDSWSRNTVGRGGYGPHMATSAFFHLPMIRWKEASASVIATSSAMPPPAAPGLAPDSSLRLHKRQLQQRRQVLQNPTPSSVVGMPLAPPPPAPMFPSGDNIPVEVHIFDHYGQKVTLSMVDSPSSVLVTCTSLNALGQKAAEAVNGIANFTQLRVRDRVDMMYSLAFTARTAIREMWEVAVNIGIRPCRINEELLATGDVCAPCMEGFYAIPVQRTIPSSTEVSSTARTATSQPSSGVGGNRTSCMSCPEGATCSSRHLGGVIVPRDGYWHSSPWSDNIMKCQYEDACMYTSRISDLAEFQTRHVNGEANGTANASEKYRAMECATGYKGNLCASCEEGYGRTSPYHCSRCRGVWVRLGFGLLVFGITFISIVATIRAALLSQPKDDEDVHLYPDMLLSFGLWDDTGPRCNTAGATASTNTLMEGGSNSPCGDLGVSRGDNEQAVNGQTVARNCNVRSIGPPPGVELQGVVQAQDAASDVNGSAVAPLTAGADAAYGAATESPSGVTPEGCHGGLVVQRLRTLKQASSEQVLATSKATSIQLASQSSVSLKPMATLSGRPSRARKQSYEPQQHLQHHACNESRWNHIKQSLDRAVGNSLAAVPADAPNGGSRPLLGMLPLPGKMNFTSVLAVVSRIHHDAAILGSGPGPSPHDAGSQDLQQQSRQSSIQNGMSGGGPGASPHGAAGPIGSCLSPGTTATGEEPRPADRWSGVERSPSSINITSNFVAEQRQQNEQQRGGVVIGSIKRRSSLASPASLLVQTQSEDQLATGEISESPTPVFHNPSMKAAAADVQCESFSRIRAGHGGAATPRGGLGASEGSGTFQESDLDWSDRGGAAAPQDNDTAGAARACPRSRRSRVIRGRSWQKRNDVISEHATVIKILVSYLQVVSLVNNTPVTWPPTLVNYFNVASQASSAASSLGTLECSMRTNLLPKSVQTFMITVLSPLYWSVALCLFWISRTAWLRYRGKLADTNMALSYLRTRCIISINCIIFIQYPSVVSQMFSLFSCMQIDTGPPMPVCIDPSDVATCTMDKLSAGLYWTQDLDQRCYRGIHLRLCLIVGVPGVLLFAAGIPLLSAWWLYLNRNRLEGDVEFFALYGTLYQEYEGEYYYWESIVMLRKFAITGVIVFAGTYRWQLTLLLALGVIAIALMAQVAYRPYISDAMDELERLGLVTTLVTFYLATYFMDETVGSSVRVGLSFAILVLNAITVFILVVAILRELHKAAIYKLVSMSDACGDLPLSFVVRIGILYLGWRFRVIWTRFRIWLRCMAPLCFPLDLPHYSNSDKEGGSGGGGGPGGASNGAGRRAASTTELRCAWDQHHRLRWIQRVEKLLNYVIIAAASGTPHRGGGDAGRLWGHIPSHVVQGVRHAARSVNVLTSRLSIRFSGSRLRSGRSSTSWRLPSQRVAGVAAASPRLEGRNGKMLGNKQQPQSRSLGLSSPQDGSTSQDTADGLNQTASCQGCRHVSRRPPAGGATGAASSATATRPNMAAATTTPVASEAPATDSHGAGTGIPGAGAAGRARRSSDLQTHAVSLSATTVDLLQPPSVGPSVVNQQGATRRTDSRVSDGDKPSPVHMPGLDAGPSASGRVDVTRAVQPPVPVPVTAPAPAAAAAFEMFSSPFLRASMPFASGGEGRRGQRFHGTGVLTSGKAAARGHRLQQSGGLTSPSLLKAMVLKAYGRGKGRGRGPRGDDKDAVTATACPAAEGTAAAPWPLIKEASWPDSVRSARSTGGGDGCAAAVVSAVATTAASMTGADGMSGEAAVACTIVPDRTTDGHARERPAGAGCSAARRPLQVEDVEMLAVADECLGGKREAREESDREEMNADNGGPGVAGKISPEVSVSMFGV